MTVIMAKLTESGRNTVELIYDPHQILGRCRGKGDYVIRRPSRKHYRTDTMLGDYRYYKEHGYKVGLIY